jgi:hypothetical protein
MKKLIVFITCMNSFVVFGQTNQSILSSIFTFINNKTTNQLIENSIWKNPKRTDIWPSLIITQEVSVENDGYILKAYNRNSKDNTWDSIIVTYQAKKGNDYISKDDVDTLYNDIVSAFGKPLREVDYGYLINPKARNGFTCQWDIGLYRVEFGISDTGYLIDGKPGVDFIYLNIMKKESITELKQLVGIAIKESDGNLILNGKYIPIEKQNFSNRANINLIIDYNRDRVLNMNYYPKGKIEEINDNQITIIISSNQIVVIRIIINRFSGDSKVVFYNEKSGLEEMITTGTMQIIDLKKPLL